MAVKNCQPNGPTMTEIMPEMKFPARATLYAFRKLREEEDERGTNDEHHRPNQPIRAGFGRKEVASQVGGTYA